MSDAFTSYLNDACRYPLLTKDQEILLARQVQIWLHDEDATPRQKKAGQRAYEKLIRCNLRLVVSVAKKFGNRMKRSEMLDLVQEGNLGLAHGIKKFDPERGYALSTYVYWWIRQSISRYLSCSDRVIRLPSHAVEMLAKLRNWSPLFYESHGRIPTIEECAEFCKTSPERLQLYIDNGQDSISLDNKCARMDSETTLLELMTDGVDPMDDLDMAVRSDYIDIMLDRLDPTDRVIVLRHFGLNGFPQSTLQAIGKDLGVSRERVRQRLMKSMRRLHILANRVSCL